MPDAHPITSTCSRSTELHDAFVTIAPADVVLHRWRGLFGVEAAAVEMCMFPHWTTNLLHSFARLIGCRVVVERMVKA